MLKDFRWSVTVRAASTQENRRSSALLLTFLPLLGLLTAAIPATALPAVVRAQPNAPNPPVCYIDRPGQTRQTLDKLCGVGAPGGGRLSLYGPDGKPSPAFLAALKRMQMQSIGGDPASVAKSLRDFAAQMPLSPNAQALMNQMADLLPQVESIGRRGGNPDPASAQAADYAANSAKRMEVFTKLEAINKQLKQEPSYIEVDKAVRQARWSK
jgi:hypothetical protein